MLSHSSRKEVLAIRLLRFKDWQIILQKPMKKLLFASLLLAIGSPAFCQALMYKQIPYNDSLATSITVIKPDDGEHVLLGGVVDSSGRPVVQKIGSNGLVAWKYFAREGESEDKSSARIADVFHSFEDEYVICLNRFGKRRISGSAAEMIVLDSNGDDLKTYLIDPDGNPYNGNLNVHKCWQSVSGTYILGSVFGGVNYDRKKNPGSVYWIQVLNSERRQVFDRFIPSTLRFRSDIVDVSHIGDEIFALATNGQDSELVKINAKSGNFSQVKIAGVAHLFAGGDELKFLVKTASGFDLQIFNNSLTRILRRELDILSKAMPVAFHSLKDGGVAVLYHDMAGNESKLIMQEIDRSYRTRKRTTLGIWTPPVVFSMASARTSSNGIILQFYQKTSGQKINFSNSIFKIENIK